MVDLALLQSVSYIAGALGVFIAAIFYVLNLRISQRNQELSLKAEQHSLETRQAQLLMQLADSYAEKGFGWIATELLSDKWSWADFDDFMKKYGQDSNPEAWKKFESQFIYWNLQGLLVRDGVISADTIFSWWGCVARDFWAKFEPIFIEYRRRYEIPPKGMMFEDLEDLYYAMLEAQVKSRKDFIEKSLPRRAEKRKAFGLEPIPQYQ